MISPETIASTVAYALQHPGQAVSLGDLGTITFNQAAGAPVPLRAERFGDIVCLSGNGNLKQALGQRRFRKPDGSVDLGAIFDSEAEASGLNKQL